MNEQMKLIEGMKKLKVLAKKMDSNSERIQQYASAPSNEKPLLGSDSEQVAQVTQLAQANKDLLAEYLHLKKRVDETNLQTTVTIGKDSYKLADLLTLRRGMLKKMQTTFIAMNDNNAESRIRSLGARVGTAAGGETIRVVRFYNETEKYAKLQEWQTLGDDIEQRLEVINATTELVTL